VFLKPGYWETGVLRTFFQARVPGQLNLPAYFWTDNCDFDSVANCFEFLLPTVADKKVEETVYLPREYVLLVIVHKHAPPPEEIGKVGFRLPTEEGTPTTAE
jgi:hypothetical protein